MTRFNTGNPLSSLSEEDFYDNCLSLDQAMNSAEPTWRDRFNVEKPTIDAALKSAGFMPAGFDFVTGGTLQPGDRNKAVYNPAPNGDNNWYRWNGVFPKEITANSQPNPKNENNWVLAHFRIGIVEKEALRRSYAEAGYNLVAGSFETGGKLVNTNDVLLHESSGKAYSGPAGSITAGTNPASGGFVDRSGDIEETFSSYTALRNYVGSAQRVYLTCRENIFDGCDGHFAVDSTSTKPDNDGTILVDGLGRRWVRLNADVLNVRWFGAKGDWDGTTGTDDTDAIQKTLYASYNNAHQAGWRTNTCQILIPRGRYRIAKANTLFKNLLAGSFYIRGEGGRGVTEVYYDAPTPQETDYLLNNTGIFGFTKFENIKFTAPSSANQNFLNHVGGGSGNAQGLTFVSCSWAGWNNLVKITGDTMCSENTFIDCKISGFKGVGFHLDNQQGVNWRFYGTDFENFSGVLFNFKAGATVNVYQGSVIPTVSGVVVQVPTDADSNTFGGGNSPHLVFHGSRFEIRNTSLITNKINPHAYLVVYFEDCGMGGYNITLPNKVLHWIGQGRLAMIRCGNTEKIFMYHSVNGAGAPEFKFLVRDTPLDNNFLLNSEFIVTNAIYNTGRSVILDIAGCSRQFDGVYHPFDNEYALDNSRAERGLNFSVDKNSLFYGSNRGSSAFVSVPPVRVTELTFRPIGDPTYGGSTANMLVELVDKDGSVLKKLAEISWIMNSPVKIVERVDLNDYVDAMIGHKLKFTFSSSYASDVRNVFYKGLLSITY